MVSVPHYTFGTVVVVTKPDVCGWMHACTVTSVYIPFKDTDVDVCRAISTSFLPVATVGIA